MKAKVSAETVRTKLRLIDRAQQDAANELPETNATSLGTTEMMVLEYCQDHLGHLEDQAREEFAKIAAKAPDLPAYAGDLANARVTLDNQITATVNSLREQLIEASAHLQRARREYLLFRRRNGRDYEPSYPSSLWLFYGFIVFMVFVESAGNGMFFAEASDRGLLGGMFYAAVISILNVGLGFFTGLVGFRYMGHRNHAHKIWSVPGVLAAYCWCIWFNLVVAYYREQLTRDPDIPLQDAVTWDVWELLPPGSFNSLVLFVFGVVIFTLAAFEGLKIYGTYPGYRQKHRTLLEAELQLQAIKEDVRDEMQDVLEAHSDPFKTIISSSQHVKTKLQKAKIDIASVTAKTRTSQVKVQELLSQLVSEYRAENIAIRQTPAPSYFGAAVALRMATLDEEANGYIENWELQAKACDEISQRAETDLRSFHESVQRRLDRIDEFTTSAETAGKEKAIAEAAELST